MIGLLYKEFYTLKRNLVSYSVMWLIFLVLAMYMHSASYYQAMVSMSWCMMLFTGMTYDKMYGWDKMVLTMPLSRETIVLAKYVTSVVMSFVIFVISTLLGIGILYIVPVEGESIEMLCVTALILFGIMNFIYSCIIPMIYRFGTENARLFVIGFFMIPSILLICVTEYIPLESIVEILERNAVLTGTFFAAVIVIGYVASYFISVKIYKNKEF